MDTSEKKKILHQLKIAKGQLEGIIRMVDGEEYCMDVLTQISASDKILKKVASIIMEQHLQICINHARKNEKKDFDKKLAELIKTFRTFI